MDQREKAKLDTVTREMKAVGAHLLYQYDPEFDNADEYSSEVFLEMLRLSPAFPAHVGKLE